MQGNVRQIGRQRQSVLLEDLSFCGRQHTLEPAQQGEGQDDAPVLTLLEVAAQQIGERPDIGGQIIRCLAHDINPE